jgi:hypothetical protein
MTDTSISSAKEIFPPLPFEAWEDSKQTLHRFAQIVGKIRLAAMPHMNHWWQVPLYVTTRGLTTDPMPYGDTNFTIDFDLIDHKLIITTDKGQRESFSLAGLSVATFYEQVFRSLAKLGIQISILAQSYKLKPACPFATDTAHATYNKEYVNRYWHILTQVEQVFKEFSGRFTGKSSPVHLFWHSFDLVVTRFSGRRAPDAPDTDYVEREAYSHEVISFGFWPGDDATRFPAFYSYTAPEPAGLTHAPLQPKEAFWNAAGTSSMALLKYDDLRKKEDPKAVLLDFLESAYRAGATTAGWDIDAFTTLAFAK